MTQRHEARKCCRENGVDRFAQLRVVTNLEFVKKWGEKKALSVEGNQAKHSKMRSADINLKNTKTHLSSRAREGKKKKYHPFLMSLQLRNKTQFILGQSILPY